MKRSVKTTDFNSRLLVSIDTRNAQISVILVIFINSNEILVKC